MADSPDWSSLEIAKLAVSVTTPLLVLVLGVWFARFARRLDVTQWMNQKLIEKRIETLSGALVDLNALYCYFAWVGTWKEQSPPDILATKRRLDKLMYANQPFFSESAFDEYRRFMESMFQMYPAPGFDARLRTAKRSQHGDREKAYIGTWLPEWNASFADPGKVLHGDVIKRRYERLKVQLALEIGVPRS